MNCPYCAAHKARVLETRDDGTTVVRRRVCACGTRWFTEERVKRSSVTTTASYQQSLPLGQGSTTASEITTGRALDASESGSSLSSPLRDPDPSKPIRTEGVNIMGETGEVAPTPFFRALRQFCEIWRTKYGEHYHCTTADRNQLGRLIGSLPGAALQDIPRAFNGYLADTNPWVAQEHGHSLRYFCTSGGFNKYRVTAPVRSRGEALADEAVRQFVNGEHNARPRR